MVDLSDKVSESEDMISQTPTPERVSSDGTHVKTCADCGTTKTPSGEVAQQDPSHCVMHVGSGAEKRRALLGLNKEEKKPKKSSTSNIHKNNNTTQQQTNNNGNGSSRSSSNNSSSSGDSSSSRFGDFSLKRRLLTFGRDVALQRPRSSTTTTTSQRRKLGEEEQAAFLLMALSCGSVYA